MADMRAAMDFAQESRARIEATCLDAIVSRAPIAPGERIETHHNFAALERHDDRDVIVHRKGAVGTVDGDARLRITIPGSMQTGSYIGLGSPSARALNTCSHGAGRRMGRRAFARQNPQDIRAVMAREGVILMCPPESDVLDEAGAAYKDIESVMRYQQDLVDPVVHLRPLGVVKG